MTKKQTTKRRGFTLMELSLTMVVAGSLMVIGVPKALTIRRQMELDAASHRFAQDLKAAQHEAVRRNTQVVVTRVGSGAYTVGYVSGGTVVVTRTVKLPEGIQFVSSPPSVTFNAFGPIVGAAEQTFEIKYASARVHTTVSPSGMVAVARPVAEPEPVLEPVTEPEPVIDVLDPVLEPVIMPVEEVTGPVIY